MCFSEANSESELDVKTILDYESLAASAGIVRLFAAFESSMSSPAYSSHYLSIIVSILRLRNFKV
jgi:hypothetical protein